DLPRMADYVAYFNRAFIGATGGDAALAALRGQLGVYASTARSTDEANYSVDHTTAIYLVDPEARLFAALPMPHDGPTLAARFRDLVRHSTQSAALTSGVQSGF
ncbi:MAG: hypothetical protein HKO62_11590, partial [Gammaproteobacteria bacterium]|nr:hypothetical protein [Gammaproteobacteria bacterium]